MADKDFLVKNGLVTGSNTVTIGSAVYFVANGNVGFANTIPAHKISIGGNFYTSGSVNAASGFYGTVLTATQATIDHNSLANYDANIHIDHTAVTLTAGNGLTGGGTIATSRSFSVVAGTGIASNSSGVHVVNTPYSLTINNGGAGSASGTTFNGSAAATISYNSIGAPSTTGTNASGTWNISINGSAAYATNAGYATSAGSATNAGYAASAGSATNATYAGSAGYASSAGSATNATYAGTAGATTTGNSFQMGSLGVGTGASGTTGEIRATNNITAYYSDIRLKNILGTIPNALSKLLSLSGIVYKNNEVAEKYGYTSQEEQVGVIAQEIEKVLPQIVKPAPFDCEYINGKQHSISGENYKTVQYEKIIPLLIEAIKELSDKLDKLENKEG